MCVITMKLPKHTWALRISLKRSNLGQNDEKLLMPTD